MSILSKAFEKAGLGALPKAVHDAMAEIERSPAYIKEIGGVALGAPPGLTTAIFSGFNKGKGGRRPAGPFYTDKGDGGGLQGPSTPYGDVNDDEEEFLDQIEAGACASGMLAGAKPWTITSTVIVNAGALAADTDLGTTSANPFSATNSAFFTTAGVFPQPFLCYGIGGTITSSLATAELAKNATLDGLYMSMRASTELARYSMTRDLGFVLSKEQGLTAAAATGQAVPVHYRRWRQFFDPRTTYVWGARLPRAVTSVDAVTYTQILHGVLLEGGAIGRK